MQCAACHAVYSNALEMCPRCKTQAFSAARHPEKPAISRAAAEKSITSKQMQESPEKQKEAATATATAIAPPTATSTLIEFPGAGRGSLPQWRKELSDRVREIQERRVREAAQEAEMVERLRAEQYKESDALPSLGLVPPPPEAPPMNPIVVAALRRIERARRNNMPTAAPATRGRSGSAATAAAVARVTEEVPHTRLEMTAPAVQREPKLAASPSVEPAMNLANSAPADKMATDAPVASSETVTESARARSSLAVVPAPVPATIEEQPTAPAKPQPRRVSAEVIDDSWLARREAENLNNNTASERESYDDYAPLIGRALADAVDLLLIAAFSAPFAVVIQMTSGRWHEARDVASLVGIALTIMLVYLTVSVALMERTFGMKLFRIRAVDARTGLAPTTSQAVRRALFQILSLVLLGIGILYALFDAEGRTAHDHVSGTIVVRD